MKLPQGILLALFASILLNGFLLFKNISSSASTPESGIQVEGVIDGDTIVLDQKTRLRLRHIDAPEKGRCGYEEAVSTLKKLVIGKMVTIKEIIPDQYGRGMGLVYVDNTLVNQAMLESGWVRYHSDKTSVTDDLKKSTQLAKDEKRGIYGECQSLINTKNPKCNIKGNIDKNKYNDNKKYYLPNCAQYQFTLVEEDLGEGWFCSEAEAKKAGFVKAETCKQ